MTHHKVEHSVENVIAIGDEKFISNENVALDINCNRKVALITGISGQVSQLPQQILLSKGYLKDGSYLAEMLLNKSYEVHGIVRRSSLVNNGRTDHLLVNLISHQNKCKQTLLRNRNSQAYCKGGMTVYYFIFIFIIFT